MKRSVLARRFVAVMAALTTLLGLSAGPCRHGEAAGTASIASGGGESSHAGGGDGGCHGSSSSRATVGGEATHGEHPDSHDVPRCHCLGACCCAPAVGIGAAVIARTPPPVVHDAPTAARPDGPAPRPGPRLLPPSTAPPAPLVVA